MEEGNRRVKVWMERIVGRGAGGRRKAVRIWCSVGGIVVVVVRGFATRLFQMLRKG